MAATQAGVRLTFCSDTTNLTGSILEKCQQKLDLCLDGSFHATEDLTDRKTFSFTNLPVGMKVFELWLPQRGDFALEKLKVDDGATLHSHTSTGPRWITYGSSITHCREASSPTRTWPAIVARSLGLNLTCLGFGGQCHLDTLIAQNMRDRPADYLSVCAGINIYGQSSLNERSFPSALIGFVKLLRERHPTTPLLIISPIYACEKETRVNAVGWTLQDYRSAIAETVERLGAAGDNNIHYFNGLRLFGEADAHMLHDRLHPNAEGYERLAGNFLNLIAPTFFSAR